MIKAVLCDLGDTLINFHEIDVLKAFVQGARQTYTYLANELKLTLPPFDHYRRSQQWAIRWAYLKSKLTGREFNSLDILRRSTFNLRIPVPEDKLVELAWQWYQPLAVQAKADSFAIPMLQELARRNLKLAIVSNTFVPSSALDQHLRQEHLLEFFPYRIYSCQVGVRKPRSKIFQVAIDQLQVRPTEAVFIGDSPSADIRGARRVSLFAILKVHHQRRFFPDSRTFLAYSLDQVPPIIDNINSTFSSLP